MVESKYRDRNGHKAWEGDVIKFTGGTTKGVLLFNERLGFYLLEVILKIESKSPDMLPLDMLRYGIIVDNVYKHKEYHKLYKIPNHTKPTENLNILGKYFVELNIEAGAYFATDLSKKREFEGEVIPKYKITYSQMDSFIDSILQEEDTNV